MRCGAGMVAVTGGGGGANRKACCGGAISMGRTGCAICGIGAWGWRGGASIWGRGPGPEVTAGGATATCAAGGRTTDCGTGGRSMRGNWPLGAAAPWGIGRAIGTGIGVVDSARGLAAGPSACGRGVATIGPGARSSARPPVGSNPALAWTGRAGGWASGCAAAIACGDINRVLRATGRELIIAEAATTVVTCRLRYGVLVTAGPWPRLTRSV